LFGQAPPHDNGGKCWNKHEGAPSAPAPAPKEKSKAKSKKAAKATSSPAVACPSAGAGGNPSLAAAFACACVQFGEAEVWNIRVPQGHNLSRYVVPPRPKGYQHSSCLRSLSPEESLANALESAKTMAEENGWAGPSEEEIRRATLLVAPAAGNCTGPDRWLMDTGSGYDLGQGGGSVSSACAGV
jgi:hypothetical protein